MKLKEEVVVKDAIRVNASFKDFDGELDKWKDSFYQVWRLQLTWGFAYRIDLCETKNGVYLNMLVKKAYKDNVLETLDGFGYKKIQTFHENVGEIEYPSDKLLDLYVDEIIVG